MSTVFDAFTTEPYTFLTLASGTVGNKIVSETSATGIVKLRDGMVEADGVEARDSTSTLHIRPNEPFLTALDGNLVGHGVRVQSGDGSPVEYRIIGQTVGRNYESGTIEHYRVTVKKESLWDESELPLE